MTIRRGPLLPFLAAALLWLNGCGGGHEEISEPPAAKFGTGADDSTSFARLDAEPERITPKPASKSRSEETKKSPQPASTEKTAVDLKPAAKTSSVLPPPKKSSGSPAPVPAEKVVQTVAAKSAKKASGGSKKKISRPLPRGTGGVKGTITFDGPVPKLKPLAAKGAATKDPTVCAATVEIPNDALIVNAQNKGIENVFIFLRRKPSRWKGGPPPSEPVILDQKNCRFTPHAIFVQAGQKLLLRNDDGVLHNTKITSLNNDGFNKAISPNDRKGIELTFRLGESLPHPIECGLHTWMRARIMRLDHPFGAITDKDGNFEIVGLPPGEHSFRVWHESGNPPYLEPKKLTVKITAGKFTLAKRSYKARKFTIPE